MKITFSFFFTLAASIAIEPGLEAREVWVAQVAASAPVEGDGTPTHPYTIPLGDAGAYDRLISSFPANTAVHLGVGVFLTKGSTGRNQVYLSDGGSLLGSGMGRTIVKLAAAAWSSGIGATILVGSSGPRSGYHHCVRDLTVDSNFGAQPGADSGNGIAGVGQSFLVENVELINLGSRAGEVFGFFIGNFAENDVAIPSRVLIRNCKVHKPWPGSSAGFSAITPAGHNAWTGVIEGCYIDLSAASKALTGGYAFAGSPKGLLIQHNVAIGCSRGVHVDTPGSYNPKAARNVIIRDNYFYDCGEGIGIGAPNDTPCRTGHFEDFTIESNTIEMVRGGNGIGLWGTTTGFRVRNNTIVKSPNAPTGNIYRTGIYVSPGAASHVVTGNRFGPSGDPYFGGINPGSPEDAAANHHRIEDNIWMNKIVLPESFIRIPKAPGSVSR